MLMPKKASGRGPKTQTNESGPSTSVKTGGTNVSASITRRTPKSGTATPTKY